MDLLGGLTGSGKTTCARRLEAGGAVRLSVDEEVYARHGRYGVDYPISEYFDRERPMVEELPRRLVDLIESGHDVVLDYGLWQCRDRDAYKRLVEARRQVAAAVLQGRSGGPAPTAGRP